MPSTRWPPVHGGADLAAFGAPSACRRRRRGRSADRPACRPRADRRPARCRRPSRAWAPAASYTLSCTNRRRSVVQRWPAVPMAEKAMPRSVRSRSAEGVTMAALLPPSSRMARAKRAASFGPTCRPIAGRAGGRDHRHAVVVDQHFADVALADQQAEQAFRRIAEAFDGALAMACTAKRGQRCLFRRLPHHRVAADQRQRRVPRPHGHGEVEGRDHAAHAQRMPGFHHAVAGALGGHRQAVELAREADREIADVDHFLHFARAFGR
jgi:hypothetical protein